MHRVVVIIFVCFSMNAYGEQSKQQARRVAAIKIQQNKVAAEQRQKLANEKARKELIRRMRKAQVSGKVRKFSH